MNDDPLRYGDIVCYTARKQGEAHDGPIMYVGECGHRSRDGGGHGLIDLFDPTGRYLVDLSHKAVEMWKRCTHE